MDLNELHVFATVAQEKSFSRAAEQLFRTQPAISMSMRNLEEWAGEPLFVRGSRATRLTDAGELLLELRGAHVESARAGATRAGRFARAGKWKAFVGSQ